VKVASVLSEIGRNILTGTARAGLFAILLGVLAGALAAADALTITSIQSAAQRYVDSGAAMRTLTTSNEVDGSTCERLTETDGIPNAGAMREADPTELPALPRSPVATFEASPAFADILGIDPQTSGIWVSQALADSFGVTAGDRIETTHGSTLIAATFDYPSDGRDARLNLAIVVPTLSTDIFDECWALVWPENPDLDGIIRSATTPGAGQAEPVTIAQLNKTQGARFHGLASFDDRITRWASLAVVVIGAGLGWLSVARRRLEYASSLHAGQTRGALLAAVLIETVVWALAAAIIGLEIVAVALTTSAVRLEGSLLGDLAQTVLGGSAAAVIGAATASLLVREKHLFRFFKERG
jgi:hypothetical protein